MMIGCSSQKHRVLLVDDWRRRSRYDPFLF